jgi:hypothetical protein
MKQLPTLILWHTDLLVVKDLETNNETTAAAMQQCDKHAYITIKLPLKTVFSMWSVPRSYLEEN